MQFVGDAVMAVFGAPFPQDDHPVEGVVLPPALVKGRTTPVRASTLPGA